MTTLHPSTAGFGAALQHYRSARRLSQLELALACDVSAKHVSFLESGRAQPSREMVARLGAGLLLPLGARNKLLQAAGFAPIFPTSPMNSVAVEPFREILNEMIAKHAPNPAMVVDRHWTVQEANNSSRTLLDALQGDGSETNIVRLLTSGPQVATVIANLPEVLSELMSRVQLEALEAGDDQDFQELIALLERATARYPRAAATTGQPILPLVVNYGDRQLRFVTAIAHFGSSEDVNVRDLRLELLFPADAETRAAIADWG